MNEYVVVPNMSRLVLASLVTLAVALGGTAQKQNPRGRNRLVLVEMERAFARAAAAKGTRAAFLEYLADDGIIFQPHAVNGKKYWSERPAGPGLLSWEPEFADISLAGDLGYTTGPWEFRPAGPNDKPAAFGQYFTIWKKQPDGSWKAVLDRGVTSEKSFATKRLEFPLKDDRRRIHAKSDPALARAELLKMEAVLMHHSKLAGTASALKTYFAPDVRLLRQNIAPVIGRRRAIEIISQLDGRISWEASMAAVAASGDLGYTYGTFVRTTPDPRAEAGSYVRVWKKSEGRWQVVIDVASSDPP